MKLVNFRHVDSIPRAGLVLGDLVVDLAAAAPLAYEIEPARFDLLALLGGAVDGGIDGAAEIASAVLEQLGVDDVGELADLPGSVGNAPLYIGGVELALPLAEVRLLAPLIRPASLRVFDVFAAHAAAAANMAGRTVPTAWYDAPTFDFGNHAAIIGPGDTLLLPQTRALDYGLAIGCVIGVPLRDGDESSAEDAIAGFVIVNLWAARDTLDHAAEAAAGRAKGRDFATSIGPWLVTPDELAPYLQHDGHYDLTLSARVNGTERSLASSSEMTFTFGQLLAEASRDVDLLPGDLLVAGPAGTGSLAILTAGRGPYLIAEDAVELAIDGLGTLNNLVVQH